MESYVGLDVSLKRTSICVVDRTGKVLCEGTVNSTPEAIVEFVKSKAAGAVRIGLETGPTSTWLWTEIQALGLPVICIDARHAKAVLKMQINKSDRNDAFGIARIMQCGWYKEVRVKGLDSHAMRALEGADYVLSERRFGSIQRSIPLPEGIDLERIEASFKKGVLTVTMPKTPEAQKSERKIAIKGG